MSERRNTWRKAQPSAGTDDSSRPMSLKSRVGVGTPDGATVTKEYPCA